MVGGIYLGWSGGEDGNGLVVQRGGGNVVLPYHTERHYVSRSTTTHSSARMMHTNMPHMYGGMA